MAAISDIEKNAALNKSPANQETLLSSSSSLAGEEEEALTDDAKFQPPDGGLVAWTQVLAGILLNMMAWGYPATFGVFQLYYHDTLGLPEAQISWIGSVQLFLTFFLCTASGRLADAGYIRSTITVGCFLVVFGTLMTSLATEYWQIFLAQGLCTGIGLGIIFMPPLTVISSYFHRRKSFALALAATGTGLGSVVFPAVIQYLIPQVGFPWAVRCSGFVALALSALALALLKPQLTPRKSGPLIEWEAFKELPYLLFTVGAFLFFWSLYIGSFFLNAYARNVAGFSTTDSVQLLLIMNGLSVPSRPIMGDIADRWVGPINLYAINTVVFGVISLAWMAVKTRAGMYIFSAFFGLWSGAAQGLFGGSCASLTEDPRKMGTRFGMVCTLMAFATLAGPPTAGAIIDKSGGTYTWAQLSSGLVIVLGGLLIWAARCAAKGPRLWVKV